MHVMTIALLLVGGIIGYWGSMHKDVELNGFLVAPLIVAVVFLALGSLISTWFVVPFFSLTGSMLVGDFIGNGVIRVRNARKRKS
jgi:hypothetical protein